MDADARFLLKFGTVAGALGSIAERLVFYLAQAESTNQSVVDLLGAHTGEIGVRAVLGALVTPTFIILLDINKENHLRIVGTAFILGAIWAQQWTTIMEIAENIVRGTAG